MVSTAVEIMDLSGSIGRFLVSLFSSSHLWISALYKCLRHGFYHLPLGVEFPRAPDPQNGCPLRYRLVAELIGSYKYIHRTFV
jgi:hypothetical protein